MVELLALADTVKVLDDDALELFKKSLPGSCAGLLQVNVTAKSLTLESALAGLKHVRACGSDLEFMRPRSMMLPRVSQIGRQRWMALDDGIRALEDYGNKSKLSFTTLACPQVSTAVVEPYNTVQCVHSLPM